MHLQEEEEKNYTQGIYVYFSMSIQPRFMYFGAGAGWHLKVSVVLPTMLLSSGRFECSHPFTWGSNSTLCAFLQPETALSINLCVWTACDCPASDQRSFPGTLVLFSSWNSQRSIRGVLAGESLQTDLRLGHCSLKVLDESVFRKKCLTSSPKKSFGSSSYCSKGKYTFLVFFIFSFVVI